MATKPVKEPPEKLAQHERESEAERKRLKRAAEEAARSQGGAETDGANLLEQAVDGASPTRETSPDDPNTAFQKTLKAKQAESSSQSPPPQYQYRPPFSPNREIIRSL